MSIVAAFFDDAFPPKSKFSVDDIPDLTGKIAIVTGSSAGIGVETVKALLIHNAKVYMANRSEAKTAPIIQKLKEETGKEAIFLKLDLSNLRQVKQAAAEYLSKENELHMLFNNAGVMVPPIENITSDGYDLQFGTNVLGHFLFTTQLLPVLLSAARTTGKPSRVINTSSNAHRIAKTIEFETLKDGPKRLKKSPSNLYAQSKLGNILFANELARRYGDQGIVSTSLHPGLLRTELQRDMSKTQMRLFGWTFQPAEKGALTQLWAGTMPETEAYNGKYLSAWARVSQPNAASQDTVLAKNLWDWLEDQVAQL
ncbi:hypothetical protein HGRIS_006391 [Hohenbuehelia grisea]|uniref:NAD(P)-binding protein n=1 Tax=Hohenbuehelia grisea TaxID=104357 RepID=A0ABR3K148_9AGAR